MGSAFSNTTSYSMAKLSILPVPMINMITALFMVTVALISILHKKVHILVKKEDRSWLLFRCVAVTGLITAIFSVQFVGVTESTVLIFSSPFFTMVLARIFLKEQFGIYECILLLVTLTGVVVVISPNKLIETFHSDTTTMAHIIGCSLAISSAFFSGLGIPCMRRLNHVYFCVLVFWAGLTKLVMSVILVISLDSFILPTSLSELVIVMGSAIFGTLASFCSPLSLRYATAGQFSMVEPVGVIFAALYQVFMFSDCLTVTTVVGSILICFSTILINFKTSTLNMLMVLVHLLIPEQRLSINK